MKVLMINGSSHKKGCTYTALAEVAKALDEESIETEILQTGNAAIRDCTACGGCRKNGGKCVFGDEDGINEIGLGPQGMGGKYSVMGVHIENTARHPSAIGVAVNVGCWSHRRGHIIFDKDLNYTITTHSGVTL